MRTNNSLDILLINPPFGTISSPYISIPTLASYLKSRHIKVGAFDLNREFYCRLLTRENILKGKEYAQKRFIQLNDQPALKFSSSIEYLSLYRLLMEFRESDEDLGWLYYPFFDFSFLQDTKDKNMLIKLTTAPYFPEIIKIAGGYFQFFSPFDPFSSRDLIEGASRQSVYTNIFEEALAPLLEQQRPRIVGFSVVFIHQAAPAFQCAYMVKKLAPSIHVTMGGPFISIYMHRLSEKGIFNIVDSMILQEGEIPLEKLSIELSRPTPDFSGVPGMVYLERNTIRRNPPAPLLDLAQSPPPDYTVFRLHQYLLRKKRVVIPFRLSKGCPWGRCTFCRTHFYFVNHCQQPAFGVIYDQLKRVIQEAGVRNIQFSDESADPLLLEYISRRLISDGLKIQWTTHTRVDKKLTRQRCLLFKEAGCQRINLGIESFNNRILRLMRKGTHSRLIESVLEQIDGALPLGAYMILGFPTETEEEAIKGYEMVQRLMRQGLLAGYNYSIFGIHYGSDIWDNPHKYGITEKMSSPHRDLFLDVIDFKCRGMERQRIYELFSRFNPQMALDEKYFDIKAIPLDGTTVPLHYDMRRIVRMFVRQTNWLDVSFPQLFQRLDAASSPLKRLEKS